MEPSKKSPELSEYLDGLCNRSEAIRNHNCVKPTFGCGQPLTFFNNDISAEEFTISGLCQKCQDKIFGAN